MKNTAILINDQTPTEVLSAITTGMTITNVNGQTGKVFQAYKQVNAGQMEYNFYMDVAGVNHTIYSFNKRSI